MAKPEGIRQRLGRRLFFHALVFGTLVTVLTSAAHLFFEYREETTGMESRLDQVGKTHLIGVREALWDQDERQLAQVLEEILSLQDVAFVSVTLSDGSQTTAGRAPDGSLEAREYAIVKSTADGASNLGTLAVVASYSGIHDRLVVESWHIIFEDGIIVFSVAIFLAFWVERTLVRHLGNIAEYAEGFAPERNQPPLALDRQMSLPDRQDELDRLVSAIGKMQENLNASYWALAESEGRLKDFAEAASDWFWEWDSELRYTYASDRLFALSAKKPEEIIGNLFTALYQGDPEDQEWINHVNGLMAQRPFRDITYPLILPDGTKRWLRLSGQPRHQPDGVFIGYRGTGTDITAEVRAREEAVETTIRFLDAIESVSDGIAFWDEDDRFVLCNRIFRAQAGAAATALVRGNSYEDYLVSLLDHGVAEVKEEDRRQWLFRRLEEHMEPDQPFELFRDGRWYLIREGRSADGTTVTVTTDVTDVKQREQYLRSVTDAVPILLAYVDRYQRFKLVNHEFEIWFGVGRQQALDKTIKETLGDVFFQEIRPHIERAMAGKSVQFPMSIDMPEGQSGSDRRHLETSFTPDFSGAGDVVGVFVAAVDTTGRVEAERTARAGEAALVEQGRIVQASFDAIEQGIVVWNEEHELIAWNQTFQRITGFSDEVMKQGAPLRALYDEAERVNYYGESEPEKSANRRYERHMAGELPPREILEPPDGRTLEVSRVDIPGGGSVAVTTDISERIEAQQQLRRAEKMKAVGQLTGGIAHDFNNLLAVIAGSLNLLENKLDDETQKKLVAAALRASRRGAELTQRLLAFGRRQALISEVTDANELIDGLLDLLKRTLGMSIEIKTRLGEDLWHTEVDRGQLENALINLAINARDAMPDGGTMTIETANIVLDKYYAGRHEDLEPGAYVMISVADNGFGMSQKILEQAVEPFFTTKEEGIGSGFGLSMIYGFAKQSGGHLRLYSEENQGTIARMYLPVVEAHREIAETRRVKAVEHESRGERVLVIEDDPDVRATTVGMLNDLGYETLEADDCASAFAAMNDIGGIDLVFTDVFLKGSKSGPEIAGDIRERWPDMPILFTSGHPSDHFQASGMFDDEVHLLAKPFEISRLATKVREMLDGPPPASREN